MIESLYPVYKENGIYYYDDERINVIKEPFTTGICIMFDIILKNKYGCIPFSQLRLIFSDECFDICDAYADFIETTDGRAWYKMRVDNTFIAGWLCGHLYDYFTTPPKRIYFKIY